MPKRILEVEQRVEAWWSKFATDVFPLLVPRTTWKTAKPELEVGSIVLVRYEQKYGKDRFRLGRVFDVRRDGDGLVRTAWVGVRALKRAIREASDVCKAGLTPMELPVQRLVMVLPASVQPPELLEGLRGFPPMPRGEARTPAAPMAEGQALPGVGLRAPLQVQLGEPEEGEIVDLSGALPQRARVGRWARR